jgi:hypothetical protein
MKLSCSLTNNIQFYDYKRLSHQFKTNLKVHLYDIFELFFFSSSSAPLVLDSLLCPRLLPKLFSHLNSNSLMEFKGYFTYSIIRIILSLKRFSHQIKTSLKVNLYNIFELFFFLHQKHPVIPFFFSDYYPELFSHLNSSSVFEFEGHFTYNQNTRKQFYCQAREKDQFAPGWF